MSSQGNTMFGQLDPGTGLVAHGASLGAILAAILNTFLAAYPPVIAAVAATVGLSFYSVQLYESKTVQTWLKKRRRRALHRLRNQIMILESKAKDQAD